MQTRSMLHLATVVGAISMLSGSAWAGERFAGDVGIMIGQKTLHESDWNLGGGLDLHQQTGYGVAFSGGMANWPVMIAADIAQTSASKSDSGYKVDAGTLEMSLGARKRWMLQSLPLIPYVGAGVEYGRGFIATTGPGVDVGDSLGGTGIWGDAGAKLKLRHFGLGLDVRYDSCPMTKKENGSTIHVEDGGFFPSMQLEYVFF